VRREENLPSAFYSSRLTPHFLFRSRMRMVISAGEVLEIKVRVNLGGADVGMPQQFLHRAQIAAGFQQVAGEGMPEEMRVHALGQALSPAPALQPGLQGARTERPAARTDEQRAVFGPGQLAADSQPVPQRGQCLGADRDDAVFAPLPVTRTSAARGSMACNSSDSSSARRSPEEYRSSMMARSRTA